MYVIPFSKKRAFMGKDRDATIAAALTEWGRRRAEAFFAKFLETGKINSLGHPIADNRYSHYLRQNIGSTSHDDIISDVPLTGDEERYIWAIRLLEGLRARCVVPSGSLETEIHRMENFLVYIKNMIRESVQGTHKNTAESVAGQR